MSHAHGGHDSCSLRFRIRRLHSVLPSLARGMTDVGVGSGALLGGSGVCEQRVKLGQGCESSIRRVVQQRAADESRIFLSRTAHASPASLLFLFRHHAGLSYAIAADAPNVKDEPRPRPARLLRASVAQSAFSFDSTCVSRRRDGRGRWLWRLVRRFGHQSSVHLILPVSRS